MDWHRHFVRPVLIAAGESPGLLLELLATEAESTPHALEMFERALERLKAVDGDALDHGDIANALRRMSDLNTKN